MPGRFERKKGIDMAIRALHEFMQRAPTARVKMVLAGGYDARLPENVQHLQELKDMVRAGKNPCRTERKTTVGFVLAVYLTYVSK